MPGSSGAISGTQAGTLEAKLPSSFNLKLSFKTLQSTGRNGWFFGIALSGRDPGMRRGPLGTSARTLPAGAYLSPAELKKPCLQRAEHTKGRCFERGSATAVFVGWVRRRSSQKI